MPRHPGERGSSMNASEHVTLRGENLVCLHCGDVYTIALPCSIPVWSAAVQAFGKEHQDCEAPETVVCSFCRAPTHDSEGHVAATTTCAVDWPRCGDTGISSRVIWAHMSGFAVTDPWPPADPDDFGRCYRLLNAPWAAEWRARIGEMAHYPGWAGLVARWDELEALYREERPTGTAPRLYEAMQRARGRN